MFNLFSQFIIIIIIIVFRYIDNKPSHHSSLPNFPISEEYAIRIANNPIVNHGKEQKLTGNHFKLSTEKIMVYHYDVQISQRVKNESLIPKNEPPTTAGGEDDSHNTGPTPIVNERQMVFLKRNSHRIVEQFVEKNSKFFTTHPYVYDGWANFYLCAALRTEDLATDFEFIAGDGGGGSGNRQRPSMNERITSVRLKLVDKIDLGIVEEYFQRRCRHLPNQIINICNLVFHNILRDNFVHNHSRYFNMGNVSEDESLPYLEFVFGFELSVRMAQIGLSLVVNPRVGCLFSRKHDKLIDIIRAMQPGFPRQIDFNGINAILKHITIYTEHGDRKRYYNFHSLIPEKPSNLRFKDASGEELSVFEYFDQRYQVNLNCEYPLVLAKSKGGVSRSQKNHLPLELCFIGKQQFINPTKTSREIQTVALRKSELKPEKFFHCIQTYVDKIIGTDSRLLREFGIHIHNRPACFKGYQLEQPTFINPNQFRITESGSNHSWALISFDPNISHRTLDQFSYMLNKEAGKMNIQMGRLIRTLTYDIRSIGQIRPAFAEINRAGIKFCLAVIPDR